MEKSLKLLLSALLVYRSNFQVLHWKAAGKCFDAQHKICEEYYNMTSDIIDDVAEMMIMEEIDPVSYTEALDVLKDDQDIEFKVLSTRSDYNFEDTIAECNTMFDHLNSVFKDCIEDCDDSEIESELESLKFKIYKEYKYLNKRRSM